VQPIYIPNNNTSNSSSSDSRSITGQQAEQVIADCPPGVRPDRLTLSGILYQQATPNFAQLRSNVALLRQHLSTRPPHAAWWHLQLSAAFESLGNTQHAQQHLDAAYDAATSRRLAAAAMYTLATMRLTAGDPEGAVAAAARGIARHVTPDLLWIAALASYRADDFRAAVAWGEMAVQLACGAGTCSIDRPAAFVDVSNWYEKPHDVLRWPYRTYKPAGCEEAAAKAERAWAAAAALRKRQVVGNSSSMFVVLGLQALPLLELQGDDEVRNRAGKHTVLLHITVLHMRRRFTTVVCAACYGACSMCAAVVAGQTSTLNCRQPAAQILTHSTIVLLCHSRFCRMRLNHPQHLPSPA
jgi:hypothetical protein